MEDDWTINGISLGNELESLILLEAGTIQEWYLVFLKYSDFIGFFMGQISTHFININYIFR
jgi:hypothetical protein